MDPTHTSKNSQRPLARIWGSKEKFALESRVLNFVLFVSTCVVLLQLVMVLALGQSFNIIVLTGSFPPIFGALYLLGRKSMLQHDTLCWLYFITYASAIILDWFIVDIAGGIALIAILVLYVLIPIITNGRHLKLATGFCTLLLFAIFILEMQTQADDMNPDVVAIDSDFVIDRVLTTLMVGFGVFVIVSMVMHNYRKQQKEINDLNNSLTQLVEQITNDNKKLKELNTTKDTFFSIIAHDLRNPIGSLATLGSMVQRGGTKMDTKTKLDLIDSISRASISTYGLLEDLLSWAQAESGRLEPQPISIELHTLVNENLKLHKALALAKNISLENKISPSVLISADKSMTNTIFRNLLGNAVKFTKPDGRVIISASPIDNMIEIQIQDDGVGIRKDQLDTLFDLKSPITTPGTSNENGSGLGLKLCKNFVELQGGRISAASNEQSGTTITFLLPAEKEERQ